jgi:hypothetical protein
LIDSPAIISFVLAALIAGEALAAGLVHWLKRSCQWIVTPKDLAPSIDAAGLQRFLDHGWDPELGWIRKPNTSGVDKGWGETNTAYHIDSTSARSSPGFGSSPISALAYGDSYTFCRQVVDDETWPEQLSRLLNGRVANFGVGNYGIDQALLRLEREFDTHPAPIVIMGVVPETISRVLSIWKHFSEYGNVFAFKPRFVVNAKKGLDLVPNPIREPDHFFRIDEFLPHLKKHDFFFRRKFMRDMIRFPYLWHLWHSRRRNGPLLKAAFADRQNASKRAAFNEVMKRNIALAAELYREEMPVSLMTGIVKRFADFVRAKDATPVLVLLPQLYDIKHIRSGDHYYGDFVKTMSRDLNVVDLGPVFAEDRDDSKNYIDDQYGGHLSAAGNAIASAKIAEAIASMSDRRRAVS